MALAEVFERVAGPDAPVGFSAFDGSEAGPTDSPVKIAVKSPTAVSYLAQAPGALGLARAYVSGHLDVVGDMYTALSRMAHAQDLDTRLKDKLKLLSSLGGPKVLFPRVPPPPQEVRVNSRWLSGHAAHSKQRDASAIHHHYDCPRTPSTSGCSGRSMAFHLRLLPVGLESDARAGPGDSSSTWWRANSGSSRG